MVFALRGTLPHRFARATRVGRGHRPRQPNPAFEMPLRTRILDPRGFSTNAIRHAWMAGRLAW